MATGLQRRLGMLPMDRQPTAPDDILRTSAAFSAGDTPASTCYLTLTSCAVAAYSTRTRAVTSAACTGALQAAGIKVSMDSHGRWLDKSSGCGGRSSTKKST